MSAMPAYLIPIREKIGTLPLILTAALGIIIRDGKLILVKTHDGRTQLPGGMPELDESIEQALTREIPEETGLSVTIDYLLGVYTDRPIDTYINGDQAKVYLFVFVCKETGGAFVPQDINEIREVVLTALEDAPPGYAQILRDFQSGDRGFVR